MGTDPFGRRLGQRGMGLERLVKDFDFPSFLIDRLKGVSVLVEITTGQIQNTGAVVFVCKKLSENPLRTTSRVVQAIGASSVFHRVRRA